MTNPILLLGATGTIGKHTLSKIEELHLNLVGFSFFNNVKEAHKIILKYKPTYVFALNSKFSAEIVRKHPHLNVYEKLDDLLSFIQNDSLSFNVVNAISGFHGLLPSLQTLKSKRKLIIANKESIALGGQHLLQYVQDKNQLIPIDSEHFSLFYLLSLVKPESVHSLFITASGGPFLFRDTKSFDSITVEETLQHPIWNMGSTITVSSATLANKGLEVLEAKELFQFPVSRIKVLIHPTSFTHAGLILQDGSFLFHSYSPSMATPIASALTYPKHYPAKDSPQLKPHKSEFFDVDLDKFPLFKIAYEVANEPHQYQMTYTLVTEYTAQLFLSKQIKFNSMGHIVQKTLEMLPSMSIHNIDDVVSHIPIILKHIKTQSKEFIQC